ncbi:MAG TPA: AAA family ATPase [Dyella sp.]|uniref:ATP-binding protein n=1 Tax=Dyella sp. TaxID=1869338 RepID=UPI002BF969EE|nr:AAA family ATPase [Dyella sp.]HUB90638.1 AAA family ATPase [Dyella sp.]
MKEFKPFRLDPINHRLWRISDEGEPTPVTITAKAFDVLRYLVEHSGRLVSHEELLEALWSGVAVQPEVLKGHVLAIRNALDDDAQRPRYLETHRGRGYRFIADVMASQKTDNRLSPVSAPPLIGRASPLSALRDALIQARQGRPKIVFVHGDAGIGKTTLVETFCREISSQHTVQSYGRCIEGFGGAEPFYPIIEVLSRLIKGTSGSKVQDALVTVAPSWGNQLGGLLSREHHARLQKVAHISARSRMLGEFCELLEVLAEDDVFVLLLEDLHWADFSTLDLISAFARRKSSVKLLLLATYRSDESAVRGPALMQLVNELLLHKLCESVPLSGLDQQDIAEYVQSDDSKESRSFVQLLLRGSSGNPLFLGAILDHLQNKRLVSADHGRWQNDVPLSQIRLEIPETLGRVVETKISGLDDETQRALEAASAVGEIFNPVVPATAAGLSARRFEEVCEALCRTGTFIHRSGMDTLENGQTVRLYRFSHALLRQALINRQGLLRLAQSHALIGKELEKSYPSESKAHAAFELAEQFSNAREWSKGLTYLKMALQTAKRRYAHQDALAILDKADAIAVHLSDGERELTQATLLEDRAAIYATNHDPRALQAFSELVRMSEQWHFSDIQARAELGMAFTLSWQDAAACVPHLKNATRLSSAQAEPQLRARTRLSSAIWQIWIVGWDAELARACEENLIPLRNGSDRQITAWGLIEYSMVCLISSRYRECLETVDANLDILVQHAVDRPEFNIFRAIWMAHLGRPWAYTLLGEWGRALKEFDASEALFVGNANRYSICTLETLRGFLYLMAGDYQAIRDICSKLGFHRDQTGHPSSALYTLKLTNEIRHCTLLAGAAEVGLGNLAEGLGILKRLEPEMLERPVITDWYWLFVLEWTLANALLQSGDIDLARLHADRMLERSDRTIEVTWRAMARELRCRVAIEEGDLEHAFRLINDALHMIDVMGAPMADWRIHRTAAELHRLQGDRANASLHEQLFINKARRLLDSLPAGHRLQETFARLTVSEVTEGKTP